MARLAVNKPHCCSKSGVELRIQLRSSVDDTVWKSRGIQDYPG